jgi:hypothetical protein
LRICNGPSLSVRRQAGSQGASQTRPQIELNGLVAVMASITFVADEHDGNGLNVSFDFTHFLPYRLEFFK